MIIKYNFVNGEHSEIEVSEEIGRTIVEMERVESNLARKERRHCYSIEGAAYEGSEYSSDEDLPRHLITIEDNERLYAAINKLPDIQKRRFLKYADGISMRKISRQEGVCYNIVLKSVNAAKKNLKKFLDEGGQRTL